MKRKGGRVWYHSIGIGLTYISAIFLACFKGPWLFKSQKTGFSVCPIFVTVWLDQAALRSQTDVADCDNIGESWFFFKDLSRSAARFNQTVT